MEDTHHHFEVVIEHDGRRIRRAVANSIRAPWSTCPTGAAGIAAMEGSELTEAGRVTSWAADRTTTCVHTVDLAALALRRAEVTDDVVFEVRLRDPDRSCQRLTVERDGETKLWWEIEGGVILAPSPFAGHRARDRSVLAAADTSDDGVVELVRIARRCAHIGQSRAIDLDQFEVAADAVPPDGSCYTHQVGISVRARRVRGSSRATELNQ